MAQEFTSGRFKSWLDSGLPNAGGRLYTYLSGTTTFKAAYTDATLATPCSYTSDGFGGQYIALNARGEAQVWLGTGSYTMAAQTALGVGLDTTDGVQSSDVGISAAMASLASAANGSGVDLIGGSGRVVTSIAALKALLKTGVGKSFVLGYYAAGDGGGGQYYYDSTDTTSADNGGSIIVTGDGGRWKLSYQGTLSVKQFGAYGDNSHDDTVAIGKAYAALGAGGSGKLYFPSSYGLGIYRYTALSFDGAIGLTLVGDGAINTTSGGTVLRCTAVGATGGISIRSSFDCTIEQMTLDHLAATFTGYLLDQSHSTSTSTQGLYCLRVTFTSFGFNLNTAKGVNLNQTTGFSAEGCKFVGLLRPVDGQTSTGGSFSNVVRFRNCQFASNTGYMANYPGIGWTFDTCNFQPCADGNHRLVFGDPTLTPWQALSFLNCTVFDATAGTTSYLSLGTGQGLSIKGGMWSAIAGATLLNATGAIQGVTLQGTYYSGFTNLLVATAAGQVAWGMTNGNYFTGITNYVVGYGNIAGLYLDGNSPSLARGSFTLAANASTAVSNTAVSANSVIQLTPTNAAAAALMGSAKFLYVSAISAGTSFTVTTGNAAVAAGTETFRYSVAG